jgi:hypothetical protein
MTSSSAPSQGPLRFKKQTNGVPKLQGVFTMRDQEGFPVDMSYEITKEHKWEVDWVEALADAARQCVLKYDALLEEIRMLEPEKVGNVQKIFAFGLMSCEGATFRDKAAHLYKRMHEPRREQKAMNSTQDPEQPAIPPLLSATGLAALRPGSNEALEAGCNCPVLDNAHGAGYFGLGKVWVMRLDCPIHGGEGGTRRTRKQV